MAKSATGAFDPQGFWLAWERSSEITVDSFGPQWNFWAVVHKPVGTLRRRHGDPASRPRRGRHPGPPGAMTRRIWRHGDVRCQHHDADIQKIADEGLKSFIALRNRERKIESQEEIHGWD